jgi:hypothetical protein
MLLNPVHFHVLLTYYSRELKKKFNRWALLKAAQKYIAVCKDFLSRCLECTFVEGRQCK